MASGISAHLVVVAILCYLIDEQINFVFIITISKLKTSGLCRNYTQCQSSKNDVFVFFRGGKSA